MIILYKIKGTLIRYKYLIVEFIINIFSFSLLIVSQQIFALPIISRFYDADQFGKIVIVFGISNIITSMFGFSIGNARLLDGKFYNSIYLKMLYASNILIVLISFIIYNYFFSGSYIEGVTFSVICLLGSIRYFFLSEYRIRNTHNWIFRQNFSYFLGILIGFLLFYFQRNWLIVFITAEVFSVGLCTYYFLKDGFFKSFKDNSSLKLSNTIQLTINNGASYSLTQYDRFIIYPILGAVNVSLYYSASVSSKIGGLIMNPLSNFILGKLANKKEESNNKVINFVILGSLLVTVLYFILSIIATPILVKILYPGFFEKIKDVILPICLGAAVMSGVNILKPITMKYIGVKYYNKIFLVYGFILIITSIILCIKYSLLGIAIAKVISSLVLLVCLLINLKRYSKGLRKV